MNEKIVAALERISRLYYTYVYEIYIGHSGGKDSCVITHLASRISPRIPIVHNPKPTVSEAARRLLYKLSMQRRVYFVPVEDMPWNSKADCCQIDGTRRAEARRTDGGSTFYMVEGKERERDGMTDFVQHGRFGVAMLYPIFDWTDEEVWQYIDDNGIEV